MFCLALTVLLLAFGSRAFAGFSVTATQSELLFHFDASHTNRSLVELAPFQDAADAAAMAPLVPDALHKKASIPRFDGRRDRIYSGFVAVQNGKPAGPMRFAEVRKDISKYHDAYPRTRSKKRIAGANGRGRHRAWSPTRGFQY